MPVFTKATFAVEPVRRVERAKDFRITIDIHQRLGTHAAAAQWQEPGRINLSQVRNKNDAVAVANLEALVNRGLFHLRSGKPRGLHLIDRDTTVGGRLSGL